MTSECIAAIRSLTIDLRIVVFSIRRRCEVEDKDEWFTMTTLLTITDCLGKEQGDGKRKEALGRTSRSIALAFILVAIVTLLDFRAIRGISHYSSFWCLFKSRHDWIYLVLDVAFSYNCFLFYISSSDLKLSENCKGNCLLRCSIWKVSRWLEVYLKSSGYVLKRIITYEQATTILLFDWFVWLQRLPFIRDQKS